MEWVENNFMVVPKMWQDAAVSGIIQKSADMMDTPPMGILGVSACFHLGDYLWNTNKPVHTGIRTAYHNRMASDLWV